jgi:hypothetical protein
MDHTPDVDWARLEDSDMDPVRISPFPEEEGKIFVENWRKGVGIQGTKKNFLKRDLSCGMEHYSPLLTDGCTLTVVHMKREFQPNNIFSSS